MFNSTALAAVGGGQRDYRRCNMSSVVFDHGDVEVDASLIAEGLLLAPSLVLPLLRDGHIVSRFERGEGDDAGRYRLTFLHDRRRLQFVVDEAGEVLARSETVLASPARGPR
jgi:hypothetical protein